MQPDADTLVAALLALNARPTSSCRCGATSWQGTDVFHFLVALSSDGSIDWRQPEGMVVIPVTCAACGRVDMFNARTLVPDDADAN